MQTQITEWSAALMTSLATAMALFFSAIPKVLGFLVILIVGWLVASLIEKAFAALLRAIRFNDLAKRSGLADFVEKMGTGTDSAGLLAAVVKWFVRLIVLVVAFDALGLPAVSDVLRQLLLWLPNVIVALVVLVIGGLAATALSNVVRAAADKADLGSPEFLAKVASTLVWAFAIVVAVNQIGIATTLVNTLFMAVVGAVALALGLSFGLGGRDTAAEIVRSWYQAGRANKDKMARAAGAAGEQIEQGMSRAAREVSAAPPATPSATRPLPPTGTTPRGNIP
ncbi:MAG: small-conductance mechanosensitive ion channel [Pseudomonadota bacterium]